MTQNNISRNEIESQILSEQEDSYTFITLPNGLNACLMDTSAEDLEEESSTDIGYCCIKIGVGYYSDPENIPGLAHLLEHMIMTTEDLKNTNESYLTDGIIRGNSCAEVAGEYTMFYFECSNEILESNLKSFSQGIVAPSSKILMVRERKAVDSEFHQKLSDENERCTYLLKKTLCSLNPCGKFDNGNNKTLVDNITDDYLLESLDRFRDMYYSAHRMNLVIKAKVSESLLKDWVVKYFSNIPNNNYNPIQPLLTHDELFIKEKFNKIYFIENYRNEIKLKLSWHMPPIDKLYMYKPAHYLSSAINHKGQGSLISYLKKKLWAENVYAITSEEGDFDNNSLFSIFKIDINLTDSGNKQLSKVLTAVFSYIKMLQNHSPDEAVFEEIKEIERISYSEDTLECTKLISHNMLKYPQGYLKKPHLCLVYDEDVIKQFFDLLNPSSVNILLLKKDHSSEIILDQTEPWFRTEYTSREIPSQWVRNWENVEIFSEFNFPNSNKYHLSLTTWEWSDVKPLQILLKLGLDVWYQPILYYEMNIMYFQIIKNSPSQSPLDYTLLSIFSAVLEHFLEEELFSSILENSIEIFENSLILKVSGNTTNLKLYLDKIVNEIRTFNYKITEDIFQYILGSKKKSSLNENLDINELSDELIKKILIDNYYTSVDKYNNLTMVSLDMLKNYVQTFSNETHIKFFIAAGSMSKDVAINLSTNFVIDFLAGNLPKQVCIDKRISKLPIQETCCRIMSFCPRDPNCITANYYQIGEGTMKNHLCVELLLIFLWEPLYDQLRSNDHLGYEVCCKKTCVRGDVGIILYVISQIHKYSVEYVEEKMTNFLDHFLNFLLTISKKEFSCVVETLIKKKNNEGSGCNSVGNNWKEIIIGEYIFGRLTPELNILLKLQLKDFTSFIDSMINSKIGKYRKLTVQVVGHDYEVEENALSNTPQNLSYIFMEEANNEKNRYFIKDINNFKLRLQKL